MFAFKNPALTIALAISTLSLATAAGAQQQQPVSGGTSGSVEGRDVSAGTSGYGSTDGSSITTGGAADAEARDGGIVDTNVDSKVNDRRAMTNSTANARDEDERARSRTRTVTRQGEVVRSRTMSSYKERGQPPVREVIRSTATPDGTTTNTNGSSKPRKRK